MRDQQSTTNRCLLQGGIDVLKRSGPTRSAIAPDIVPAVAIGERLGPQTAHQVHVAERHSLIKRAASAAAQRTICLASRCVRPAMRKTLVLSLACLRRPAV